MRVYAGTFCFLQEVIGSNAAGLPPPQIPKDAAPLTKALARARIDSKAVKMALYGFFVSAPMGHFLVGMLQKAFAGKTGLKARLGQLLASNLLISPINAAGAQPLLVAFVLALKLISSVLGLYGYHQWCQIRRRGHPHRKGWLPLCPPSKQEFSSPWVVFLHSAGIMGSFPIIHDHCTTVYSC